MTIPVKMRPATESRWLGAIGSLVLLVCALVRAEAGPPPEIVAQWTFNGVEPDANAATGNAAAALGSGSAAAVGTATSSFGAVGTSPDPDPDNSSWRLASFPPQFFGPRTTGAEFVFDASLFQNLRMTWYQRNSDNASRYWRVQTSTNNIDFVDQTVIISTQNVWQAFSADFSLVPGASQNPAFAVRIVSDFQRSATGSGGSSYLAANRSSPYLPGGILWLDLVTFTGELAEPGNQPPTLAFPDLALPGIVTRLDTVSAPLTIRVSDPETPAEQLLVEATSDNPDLIAQLEISGSGSDRQLVAVPMFDLTGQAEITVTVTDGAGRRAGTRLPCLVLPPQTPPRLVGPRPTSLVTLDWSQQPNPLPITVSDLESAPDLVQVTVTSTNSTLFPPGAITITGTGAQRQLHLPSSGHQPGTSLITLTATDPDGLSSQLDLLIKYAPSTLISAWNYNSANADRSPGTGSAGSLGRLGFVFPVQASFSGFGDGLGSTDPNENDNSDGRLTGFAPQGQSNKLTGVEMRADTTGFESIVLFWDQRNSDGASRYQRVQYSLDSGASWIDGPGFELTHTDWHPQLHVNLADVPGAANHPGLAVRVVTEFIRTAVGAGPDSYAATRATSSYTPLGVQRYDMILLHGEPIQPRLLATLSPSSAELRLQWPVTAETYTLESASHLDATSWEPVPATVELVNERWQVLLPFDGPQRYFRLRR